MSFADAEKIATAILYEGYLLYPYRATAIKNIQRWNFGTLYPQIWAEEQRPPEAFRLQAECLIKSDGEARLNIRARFLHLVRKYTPESRDWDEGVDRSCDLSVRRLKDLAAVPLHHDFSASEIDIVTSGMPNPHSSPLSISARMIIEAKLIQPELYRLSVQLLNITPMKFAAECHRDQAMLQSLVSAHVLLGIEGGKFVSLLDPPEEFLRAAADCNNVGVFPVLAGEEGQQSMMLCSPIILYDYPQIAPESAGDFFDGTEMDEMLALRVMTLTEEEKKQMRGGDERARRILERTETLPQEFLNKMHGAIRSMRPAIKSQPEELEFGKWDPLAERPAVDSIRVFGVNLKAGDRVRLWPQKTADIMDMALKGKVALIEAIEQDFEDNIQLAVVLDDDPGREFGMMRQPGHRFFFSPDEVEPFVIDKTAESV
jgi:hypothetical protein